MRAGYADHFRADESRLVRTQYHIHMEIKMKATVIATPRHQGQLQLHQAVQREMSDSLIPEELGSVVRQAVENM